MKIILFAKHICLRNHHCVNPGNWHTSEFQTNLFSREKNFFSFWRKHQNVSFVKNSSQMNCIFDWQVFFSNAFRKNVQWLCKTYLCKADLTNNFMSLLELFVVNLVNWFIVSNISRTVTQQNRSCHRYQTLFSRGRSKNSFVIDQLRWIV